MVNRELNDKEKKTYERSVETKEKELEMWQLQVDVVANEMEWLPKKTELALYGKSDELNKSKLQLEVCKRSLDILNKHLKEGVEEKEEVTYEEPEVKE